MWTQFWDMHSGGDSKEKQSYIYIEAPEKEAKVIFYNRFGHSPDRVSCTCCGPDYSVSEGELDQLTAFHRGAKFNDELDRYVEEPDPKSVWAKYSPLEEYLKQDDVLVIRAKEIKPEERVGEVSEQGYVWQD